MFSGIVEARGSVAELRPEPPGCLLIVREPKIAAETRVADSISVNGCCLTVVELGDKWWAADAVVETLARTNLGELRTGDPVNLERPVRLADRLGGHLVQGHVDATGTVVRRDAQSDGSVMVRFQAPPGVLRYVVHKGSITVDGVSLTVAALHDDGFTIAVIPHTLAVTTLGFRDAGARVNLEVDLVAKYVERLLDERSPS